MLECPFFRCTSSMSQAVFDQLIHHFFQNLSADTRASRDEEKTLFCAQELRIEVLVFVKIPPVLDQNRIICKSEIIVKFLCKYNVLFVKLNVYFSFFSCRILKSSPSLVKAPLHVFTGQNR